VSTPRGARPGPSSWRGTLLVLPAVLPVVAVLGVGVSTSALQSLGLMPLVGTPRLSTVAWTSSDLLGPAALSLAIALASTVLAAVVGLAAALAVLGGGRLVALAGLLTVPVPHLVGAATTGLLLADSGLAARVLGVQQGWPQLVGGPWWVAVVFEHAWKESAFVALVVAAALAARAEALTETAATLGAGRWRRLRHVTLPLAAPALVASSGIVLVYTLGSYEVAQLLGRPAPEPLAVGAVRLFTSIDLAARPQAAALATASTVLCLLAVVVVGLVLRRLAAWR
jgi:putative spermidine/putrescine transport system permease protein